ncbi:5-formyltetrahydrofolate cyclo-ligase [Paraeggerthella sp. Marseille-Q4926]|uniref:5-formyltetrahydrofolate cyclo-ligase n=1 Tax=Paraeggerthella sp. Marseille-Q4926 TaxID=2866587 RepID=UPI001CE47A16|nr:5-formyltetrahydrofolate cyclo-ligase [Paraeggerthella sp. Marseille-Q4926]
MDEKKRVREEVLRRRDALSAQIRARKSLEICLRLERLIAECLSTDPASEEAISHTDAKHASGSPGACFDKPCIAVFSAMRSEVDLSAFVQAAHTRAWSVCFPCMLREAADQPARMALYRVTRAQLDRAQTTFLDHPLRCLTPATLERNGFEAVHPNKLDVVAVPLVAFDGQGNRLGYGGGNYDRLLPNLRADALVVGVAFSEQRVEVVPCEPHDQPLPLIISA